MSSLFRGVMVSLLVLVFAAAVPAGTLAGGLAVSCPTKVQADACCESGAPNADCMVFCAVSVAPVVDSGLPFAASAPQSGIGIPFAAMVRSSLARAPDTAPPKIPLV